MWITPVSYRTPSDVEFASIEANRNLPIELIGALDYRMINRVCNNINYLSDLLREEYGFNININLKSNWVRTDDFRVNHMQQILNAIEELKSTNFILPSTPLTPDVPISTYWKANNMEQIILDIGNIAIGTKLSIWYSGELMSGEIGVIA